MSYNPPTPTVYFACWVVYIDSSADQGPHPPFSVAILMRRGGRRPWSVMQLVSGSYVCPWGMCK